MSALSGIHRRVQRLTRKCTSVRFFYRKQFYVLLLVTLICTSWKFFVSDQSKQGSKSNLDHKLFTRKASTNHSVRFLFPKLMVIDDADFNLTVVSAFYDYRMKTSIILITIGSHELYQDDMYCHMITEEGNFNTKISDKVPMIEGRKGYTEHFVYCPNAENRKVLEVGLFFTNSPGRVSTVPVVTIPSQEPEVKEIAICVRPIASNEFTASHLITWIEFNRILGVNHFIFYNYFVRREFKDVFAFYEALELVTTVNWDSVPFLNRAREFGVIGMMNDCVRRFTNRFHFVMFTDPTELIVPNRSWRLDELISDIEKFYLHQVTTDPATRPVAAFTFQVNFLIDKSPQASNGNVLQSIKNVSQSPFFRTTAVTLVTSPFRMGTRIVVGKMVTQVGTNFVMETENSAQAVLVNDKLSKFYSIASPIPDDLNFFSLPKEEKNIVKYKARLSVLVKQVEHFCARYDNRLLDEGIGER